MDRKRFFEVRDKAGKMGYSLLYTGEAVEARRITVKNGIRKRTIVRVDSPIDTKSTNSRQDWEREFNQFASALSEFNLEIAHADGGATLVHKEQGPQDIQFPYSAKGIQLITNYVTDLYLEGSGHSEGVAKMRRRHWEREADLAINKALDEIEAELEKEKAADYKELAELFWLRMDAIQQQNCIDNFTGRTKERLIEMINKLSSQK